MNTNADTIKKPLLQNAADKLLKAQQELDELVVQFALGKAEAKDKFEVIKKELRVRVSKVKPIAASLLLGEATITMQSKFEELELQLALGKAETKESFKEQVAKILTALKSLEREINDRLPDFIDAQAFHFDIEKFKLKVEILRLKFELKKFEIKDTFSNRMNIIRKSIKQLKNKTKSSIHSGVENVEDEMYEIYKGLRKAVKDLY